MDQSVPEPNVSYTISSQALSRELLTHGLFSKRTHSFTVFLGPFGRNVQPAHHSGTQAFRFHKKAFAQHLLGLISRLDAMALADEW